MWLKLNNIYLNSDQITSVEILGNGAAEVFTTNGDSTCLTLHNEEAQATLAYLDSVAVDITKVDPKTLRPLPPTTDTTGVAPLGDHRERGP